MGPKGKKCWCVIIPNLMWWFSKDKSLIWHRTPYEKKTSSPLLRGKKYFPVAKIGFSGLFLLWLGVYLVHDSGPQRLTFKHFQNFRSTFETSLLSRLLPFLRVRKIWYREKVSVSVSKNLVSTSLNKQVGGDMRSDNLRLACVQPSTSLQKRPLRLFKQVIWGDIWQLPLERNTVNGSDRTKRTGHTG